MPLEATEKQLVARLNWGFADKVHPICIRTVGLEFNCLWAGTEMSVKGWEVPANYVCHIFCWAKMPYTAFDVHIGRRTLCCNLYYHFV